MNTPASIKIPQPKNKSKQATWEEELKEYMGTSRTMTEETYAEIYHMLKNNVMNSLSRRDVSHEPKVAVLIDGGNQSIRAGVSHYKHGCLECLFLGNCKMDEADYDLYECSAGVAPLVARHSDKPDDYISMAFGEVESEFRDFNSTVDLNQPTIVGYQAIDLMPLFLAYKLSVLERYQP